ncbi:MAG TPA: hypothetical protein PLI34_19020, partial [Saprospiraceae bacterium]|nr:hypothetical protein [Saprospiraceae bacterium]
LLLLVFLCHGFCRFTFKVPGWTRTPPNRVPARPSFDGERHPVQAMCFFSQIYKSQAFYRGACFFQPPSEEVASK